MTPLFSFCSLGQQLQFNVSLDNSNNNNPTSLSLEEGYLIWEVKS